MRVHILVTVLNPVLFAASRLVFDTIRTGFPRSEIIVYGHGLNSTDSDIISRATDGIGARFIPISRTSHGEWIEHLLAQETGPFWICDTDVVFFDPVEDWFRGSNVLFAGRFEPEFFDTWTGAVHVERLHPSLMWFNPVPLRAAMRAWPGTTEFFGTVELNLIRWAFVPRLGKPMLFYDTCAGLHHALDGQAFTEDQNKAFAHLFCGTYADQNRAIDLRPTHAEVFRNPESARELWARQQEWYKQMSLRPEK